MSSREDRIPPEMPTFGQLQGAETPTLGMLIKLLMETPRRMIKGLAKSDPGGSPETAVSIPGINASTEELMRYGFDMNNIDPDWLAAINTPFVQDTAAAITGSLPTFGMAGNPYPRGATNARAFVPNALPSRAYLNPNEVWHDPAELPPILLHESIHSAQMRGDPDLNSLMKDLKPSYDALVTDYINKREKGEETGYLTRYAVDSPGEHLSYTIQLATNWLRNKESPERLEELERDLPGVKKALEFVQKKLGQRGSSNDTQR